MCKIVSSEIILKSYFTKYPQRKKITYQKLKEIRLKAEPVIHNIYIDITYSSIRALKYTYPDSISIENDGVRIVGQSFKEATITDKAIFNELESYL